MIVSVDDHKLSAVSPKSTEIVEPADQAGAGDDPDAQTLLDALEHEAAEENA